MTRAYSQDLRDRVIATVEDEGLSRREAARRYRISDASAVRWLQALRHPLASAHVPFLAADAAPAGIRASARRGFRCRTLFRNLNRVTASP